jgi:hypothetical protein
VSFLSCFNPTSLFLVMLMLYWPHWFWVSLLWCWLAYIYSVYYEMLSTIILSLLIFHLYSYFLWFNYNGKCCFSMSFSYDLSHLSVNFTLFFHLFSFFLFCFDRTIFINYSYAVYHSCAFTVFYLVSILMVCLLLNPFPVFLLPYLQCYIALILHLVPW